MRFLIISFSFLILSCGNNVSKKKVENQKNKIIEWGRECNNYIEMLEKISQIEKMINQNKSNIDDYQISKIIEDHLKFKSEIRDLIEKKNLLDYFGRSYEKMDLFYNKFNTMIYKIIGNKEKLEMYEFERVWFLPKTNETNYMGYDKICNIQLED